MTRYAILRLVNGHAEPLYGNLVKFYEEKNDALVAGREALCKLADGQRLAVVCVIGEWKPREGFDYRECETAPADSEAVSGEQQGDGRLAGGS